MRWLAACALLTLAFPARAEDVVHLKNGNVLVGSASESADGSVVVSMDAGAITVSKDELGYVERNAIRRTLRRQVTQRDEWFLVLHRHKVVGWRRIVETSGPERVIADERTVFFRPGGGDDVSIHRVEECAPDGRPIEFLYSERYDHQADVTTGRVRDGTVYVTERRRGNLVTRELKLAAGWTLALPAWSRFLAHSAPGETRDLPVLDTERLKIVHLLLHRDPDKAISDDGDLRCRDVVRRGTGGVERALYRAGKGALRIELNGTTLVAQRCSEKQVELARRAHAAPLPLTPEEALYYPFRLTKPETKKPVALPLAGLSLVLPDRGWKLVDPDRSSGLVGGFEKVDLFSSFEAFSYPLPQPEAGVDTCFRRALTRLRLTARSVSLEGAVEHRAIHGLPARTVRLEAEHRGESLRCLLTVVRAPDRYLVLLGASPRQWWPWGESAFEEILASLRVVPDQR